MDSRRIGVIGGGPAGCEIAARLGRAGVDTVLFDPSFDREKPCGGGVPWRGLREFPALALPDLPAVHVRHVLFEAPTGATAALSLPAPLRIFSRRTLDGKLAAAASEAGAALRREKVVSLLTQRGVRGGITLLTASGAEERFDFVVGADGARSLVRNSFAEPFAAEDLSQAIGYFIPRRTEDTARIAFRQELPGYLWSFPRVDHLAVGACAPLESAGGRRLREALDGYLRGVAPGIDSATLPCYSALIPSLSARSLDDLEMCGEGWCLIGDAAGTVDSLTREGIYYGLRSAMIASAAMLDGRPGAYPSLWRAAHGEELRWAASRREKFFDPELTERLVRYLDSSSALRRIMTDLILGNQPYRTLKRRLMGNAIPFLLQRTFRKLASFVAGSRGS